MEFTKFFQSTSQRNMCTAIPDDVVDFLICKTALQTFLPLSVMQTHLYAQSLQWRSTLVCAVYWRSLLDKDSCLGPWTHRGRIFRSLLRRPRHKRDSRCTLVRYQPLLIRASPYTACEVAVQFLWQSLEQSLMQSWITWVGSLLDPGGAADTLSSFKIDLADFFKEHNNLHGFTKAF